jgi:uncharacterized damage-inducible protein DinB
MPHEFTTSYLADSRRVYEMYKTLGERAMAQVSDDQLTLAPDPESNSIALIVKHIAGNLRSRWRDFLTSDGEKPDRDRDSEFEAPAATRAELLAQWEAGWETLFHTLDSLADADLGRSVTIRGMEHSVMQAINRNITHTAHHVGQIVFLAKHLQSEKWQSLSIPKGKSAEINTAMHVERLWMR